MKTEATATRQRLLAIFFLHRLFSIFSTLSKHTHAGDALSTGYRLTSTQKEVHQEHPASLAQQTTEKTAGTLRPVLAPARPVCTGDLRRADVHHVQSEMSTHVSHSSSVSALWTPAWKIESITLSSAALLFERLVA